jgi:hypothetical protein
MKKSILLALLALAFTPSLFAQVPSYVPTNDLVGYWPFSGNANDESGNGNNGVVSGATLTTDRFGNVNESYYFNGTTSGIQINNTLLSNQAHSYTYNFWCLLETTDSSDNGYTIFDDCDSNQWYGKGRFFLGSQLFTGKPAFQFREYYNSPIDNSFTSNVWINYSCVFDYENQVIKLYKNGVLVNTQSYEPGSYTVGNRKTQFGRCETPIEYVAGSYFTGHWLGKIDDIGLWNRALTTQEITNLYNSVSSNECLTMVINSGALNTNPVTYTSTVNIYPNPANDHITIDCGNLANVVGWSIKITNALGQEVFAGNMNTQQYYISLNSWAGQGMYFVKIINAQNEVVNIKKIILQ